MAKIAEFLKVTNKITICAEDTNELKNTEWAVDNMIQKKAQTSTICWWRKHKWEPGYNLFTSK